MNVQSRALNIPAISTGHQNLPVYSLNHPLHPLLFNIIAKSREVILYDSFGIGHSEGAVPDSTTAMASIAAKLLAAIGVSKVDAIGFSMGGRVAQILAWDDPQLIHKLVLASTQSAIGDGVVLPSRDVLESAAGRNDVPLTEQEMHGLFFYPSETSLAAGKDWWKRIHERQMDGEERKEFLVGRLGHS
ncbi:hypothetical protein H9L39_04151 [Fusarium oxysporum f. sp. albedinis]|nr:hypothetical protein H9L39_04151 [Fusarium oxysporum f. sp. albedinis]